MGWITYTYSQYTRWETREYTTLLYYTLHQKKVDEKKLVKTSRYEGEMKKKKSQYI